MERRVRCASETRCRSELNKKKEAGGRISLPLARPPASLDLSLRGRAANHEDGRRRRCMHACLHATQACVTLVRSMHAQIDTGDRGFAYGARTCADAACFDAPSRPPARPRPRPTYTRPSPPPPSPPFDLSSQPPPPPSSSSSAAAAVVLRRRRFGTNELTLPPAKKPTKKVQHTDRRTARDRPFTIS
jgi:hypothetical protein